MTLGYSGKDALPLTIYGDSCEDIPLHESIDAAIQKYPDRIALSYKERQLTYSELNVAANNLALMLADQNIGHRDNVAVLMHRTDKMIVSLLAILRLGAAYIPIDPGSPDKRVNFILEDTGARALILGSELNFDVKNLDVIVMQEEAILLDKHLSHDLVEKHENSPIDAQKTDLLPAAINPKMDMEDLAYIIYTSGSTGLPKGVKVTHANAQNYSYWARIEFGLTEVDIVDFSTTMAFDIAFGSTILPLMCGATVEVCPERIKELPEKYLVYMRDSKVNVATLTPSYFSQLRQALEYQPVDLSIRAIWLAGEALIPADINVWLKYFPEHEIINEYGPTETTIGIFTYKILVGNPYLETASVPIGVPAYNSTAYILDSDQNICAEGEPGELCIAGKSVSKGYVNRPDLNKASFIDDPFSHQGKLYRTGDLVRMLDDGNMAYLGRIDRQIKIRGYRIEPGEIETVLIEHHKVQSVAIVPHLNDTNTKLIAYVVTVKDAPINVFELRQFLKKRLPDYMLPNYFMFLSELPLNVNGKLDREALPLPTDGFRGEQNIAPSTEFERSLLILWASVLGVSEFGVTDDFFHLGGDSLAAAQIIHRIEKEFFTSLSLLDFYANANIRSLAEHIDKKVLEALKEDNSYMEMLSQIESMSGGQVEEKLKK